MNEQFIYRMGFYLIAGGASLCAAAGFLGSAVWFLLMAPVAFCRGRMWE